MVKKSNVKLQIFNLLGQNVATLVNQQLQPGTYEVVWNASQYASGVYFYKITSNDFAGVKKMLIVK